MIRFEMLMKYFPAYHLMINERALYKTSRLARVLLTLRPDGLLRPVARALFTVICKSRCVLCRPWSDGGVLDFDFNLPVAALAHAKYIKEDFS